LKLCVCGIPGQQGKFFVVNLSLRNQHAARKIFDQVCSNRAEPPCQQTVGTMAHDTTRFAPISAATLTISRPASPILSLAVGEKPIVRGGKVEALEGQPDGRPMVVFEFPSMEAIHTFWNSPEYVPVKKLRQGAATLNIWAVPGS
jgi:uncharacterized protein (DUF1330 family)